MRLADLLVYNNIIVQCHDNPDADAIASGYAVYTYLQENGRQVRFIYGGSNVIRKSNLLMMVKELEIPIEHIKSMYGIEPAELVVTVDCQYGEGNVTEYPAKTVAVLDHHRVSCKLPELSEVHTNLGACSTLLWEMLQDEKYPVNDNMKLATALYYGLYMDTGGMEEIFHPKDMELRDEANIDTVLITKLRNSNLSIEELETAGAALLRCDYNEKYRFAVVKTGPCDPNLLGIISDLVLEVYSVDVCLVFSILPTGVKISVRSCIEEIRANELAATICYGIGSGGGHNVKAGGFLQMELLTQAYESYCRVIGTEPRMEMEENGKTSRPSMSAIKSLLEQRMIDYFEGRETVEAVIFDLDGTLLDTLEDLKDSVNAALTEYGLPERSLEEVRFFVGNGIRRLIARSVPEGEEHPEFEKIFAFFKEHYRQNCVNKTVPYEGIMELIGELSGRGVKMAIVSNKFDVGVKALNEKFFKEYIEVAIGEIPGGKRKPDPESVNMALQLLGVDKEHALYVGDSDVDIATAKNAEMRCVSVSWGFRDETFLLNHGAGVVIGRPLELLEYI